MTDNQHLLAEYRQNGSDAAFRELVEHFLDLVYSTALRLVEGDTHRAQDVTQTVFVNLARKARMIPADVKLGGWLHRDTCLVAGHTLRGERRRQARERQAVEMNTLQNHSEADFSQVAPLLDEAINELGEADRTAILLRFFEQQDFRAVGQALGSNEDAARMRVTRALEKLEEFLKRRGVTTTAASLGVVLTANAVQAAPVGLAVTISTAAALAGTTIAATATATAIKTIAMTTLQKTLITATIVAAVGTGIYEVRQAATLRGQVQTLQQQHAEQIAQLTKDREDMTRQLGALRDDNERLNLNTAELLKLRGELARLRNTPQSAMQSQGADGTMESLVKSWLARVNNLKQRLEQTPGAKIPELQYLSEADWINIAKDDFKTDEDYRKALAGLRMEGATRFVAWKVKEALTQYAEANNGLFPTDVSQLQPYFKTPEESAILQRYQVIPGIYLGNDASYVGDWAITQKAAVDEKNDVRISIGPEGILNSLRTETDGALDSAISAFTAANNGRMPTGIYDLQPYITTPAAQAAFRKRILSDYSRTAPVGVPIYR